MIVMPTRGLYYNDHVWLDLTVRQPRRGQRRKTYPSSQSGRVLKTGIPILEFPHCHYCGAGLQFFGQPDNSPFYGDFSFAGECKGCGWWFCETGHVFDAIGEYRYHRYYEGILRRFEIDRYEVPLSLLRKHLSLTFADVRNIHPRRFEELCESVFREHFRCDVRLTGYSADGGIDLYVVHGDTPFVVQLKRRTTASHEGVAAIREFVGALVLQGETRGLFVTTGSGYSPAARQAAANHRLEKLGIKLELVDYTQLSSMFKSREPAAKPWKAIPDIRTPSPKRAGVDVLTPFPW